MTAPSFAPSWNASTATTGVRGSAEGEHREDGVEASPRPYSLERGEVSHYERRDAEECDLDPVDGDRLRASESARRQADTGTGGPRCQGRREGSGAPGRVLAGFDDYRFLHYPAGRE